MAAGFQRLVYAGSKDPASTETTKTGRADWLTPRLRARLDERRRYYQRTAPPRLQRRSQRTQILVFQDAYSSFAREAEERSMARQGLELRLPFYDPKIIQFALSTPERLRSLGRSTKYFHRRALRGALPESVLRRTTKADFMSTFRRQLDESEAELGSRVAERRRNWIEPDRAVSLIERRREPSLAGWVEWRLWSLAGCDALV
jgi:asparagine synthase (glutamine-hydrolysing)